MILPLLLLCITHTENGRQRNGMDLQLINFDMKMMLLLLLLLRTQRVVDEARAWICR